ncbi:MAG: hypothetical protein L0Y80_02190 [Ignavibacteriae bacterium]|nr:hypothetical protein [Ignavibacteriota bacterium]
MTQATESHTIRGHDQLQGNYVLDVSQRSIVALKGKDGLDLLQRISTNDVAKLEVGKSVQTVLTNEKGKIVDVISVVKISDSDLLLAGNTTGGETLSAWLEKYIIMEDAAVENLTGSFSHFLLYGGQNALSKTPTYDYEFTERLGEGLLYHVLAARSGKDEVLARLHDDGYIIASNDYFTQFRVEHGIPGHPSELSLEYNPMEAGLVDLISFTKGCYIGQEVIARLDTYKKVQKRLSKLKLGARPETVPTPIFNSKEEVGLATTVGGESDGNQFHALGYIKSNMSDQTHLFILKDAQSIQVNITV